MTKIDCEVKEVNAERRKVTLCSVNVKENFPWYAQKFSNYHSRIGLVAGIKRFIANCPKRPEDRNGGEISNSEFENGEKILIRTVQRECFPEPRNLPIINVVKNNKGLLRVKTKITECKDDPCFLKSILLPANCALTPRLVGYLHKSICHASTQVLLSIIGENIAFLNRGELSDRLLESVSCADSGVTENNCPPPARSDFRPQAGYIYLGEFPHEYSLEGAGNASTSELTREMGEFSERTLDAEVDNPGLRKGATRTVAE
ncbi:integrase_H2C2 domain-containing protein [Trichonephila clavipes]|nr:integrase_H2C2 domain-containing protein [Trichonephila clavipes]